MQHLVDPNPEKARNVAAAGVTSYGSQICMTNSLRHVNAAPALAMSCGPARIMFLFKFLPRGAVR